MCVLRVLHIRLIAFAVAAPGFDRPDDDRVLAKERPTKAFAVPRAGPELLFVPGASGGPRHRLPERADKPTIYPHHQIDVAPLKVACAIVIPVQDPVRRSGERFFQGCKKLIIRCPLPVRSPVKPVHLNVRDSQRLRDSPAKRAFPTSAGAYDIDFHRSLPSSSVVIGIIAWRLFIAALRQ